MILGPSFLLVYVIPISLKVIKLSISYPPILERNFFRYICRHDEFARLQGLT